MKKACLLSTCLLTLLFCLVKAQDQDPNKILAMKDDSLKVKALSSYIVDSGGANPRTARLCSEVMLKLSKQLHFDKGTAAAYSYLGYFDINEGKYASSEANFNEAIKYFKKLNKVIEMAGCLGNLSDIYNALGRTDSGIILRMSAIELLEKSRNINEKLRLHSLSNNYYNLAVIYGNIFEDLDKSFTYYKKAAQLARQGKDTVMLVTALNEITNKLINKGSLTEASAAADEALNLSKTTNDNLLLARGYAAYSSILNAKNETKAAVTACQKAVQYSLLANSADDFIAHSLRLGRTLKKIGNYKEEIKVLNKAIEKANEIGQIMYSKEIYEELAEANFKQGNYKEAYQNLKNKTIYKDSLVKAENNRFIAEIDTKYQTAQKEKILSQNQLQLAQKDLQLQKNRYYMYYSIAALIVALLIIALIYLQSRYKKQAHEREVKSLLQQKELHLLQALMQGEEKERSRIAKDLHDGVAGMLAAVKMHFSSITTSDNLLHSEGYHQGMKLLNEATQEIRKTSHNLMPEVLLQHGLDEALRRYCNNVTNSKTLQIQYDSWGEIGRFNDGFELSVYRIIQELLNNIIKHSKATQAIVQLTQQNDVLSISIEDNGIGFTNENNKEGMGLRSLQSRIKAMNGKLEVEASEQSGVSAYLEFEIADLKKEIEAEA